MKLYKVTHERVYEHEEPIVYIVAKSLSDLEVKIKLSDIQDWVMAEPMTIEVVVNDLFGLIAKWEGCSDEWCT